MGDAKLAPVWVAGAAVEAGEVERVEEEKPAGELVADDQNAVVGGEGHGSQEGATTARFYGVVGAVAVGVCRPVGGAVAVVVEAVGASGSRLLCVGVGAAAAAILRPVDCAVTVVVEAVGAGVGARRSGWGGGIAGELIGTAPLGAVAVEFVGEAVGVVVEVVAAAGERDPRAFDGVDRTAAARVVGVDRAVAVVVEAIRAGRHVEGARLVAHKSEAGGVASIGLAIVVVVDAVAAATGAFRWCLPASVGGETLQRAPEVAGFVSVAQQVGASRAVRVVAVDETVAIVVHAVDAGRCVVHRDIAVLVVRRAETLRVVGVGAAVAVVVEAVGAGGQGGEAAEVAGCVGAGAGGIEDLDARTVCPCDEEAPCS